MEQQQPSGASAPEKGASSSQKQQAAAAERRQPEPPADAHRYVNDSWQLPSALTESSIAHPPPVVFTKTTLKRLFGWQHGSCKDVCPTVVFRCTPLSGGVATELEPVQLLPPSRDDQTVTQMKREGGKRGRVDGYTVPVAAVKSLLAQLFGCTSPSGRKLHFRSAGWRGTQLVLNASHEAANAEEGAGKASDGEAQQGAGAASRPGPQLGAGGSANYSSAWVSDVAAAAASAPQQEVEPASAAGARAPQQEAQPAAAVAAGKQAGPAASGAAAGRQPTANLQGVDDLLDGYSPITPPQYIDTTEEPVMQAAASHSFSGLGGLAAAAAAAAGGASAGASPATTAGGGHAARHPRPLMECLDSLQPAAQRIVQAAQVGWLETDKIYKLMLGHESLGVPLIDRQPNKPKAGDLFLADYRHRLDLKPDGLNWIDRRSNMLKVNGETVLKVVYYTTQDKILQRRAYHLLPDAALQPEVSRLQLLHYQLLPTELDKDKGKPGPKKRTSNAHQSEAQPQRHGASQPRSPPGTVPQQQGGQPAGGGAPFVVPGMLDVARWNRQEKIWAECGDIVRHLLDGQTRKIFGQPTDPNEVPEYYKVVKQPMDLGTVLSKLSATPRGYTSPLQLRDDVRLTFANCRLFYPEGTDARCLCEAASARFETEWKVNVIETRWEANLSPSEQQQVQQQVPLQQPAGRSAHRTSPAQATGAAAAEAAAAAGAAQGEAEAAATRSPHARLAQQRAGKGERMYTGSYDLPDLDGKQPQAPPPQPPAQQKPVAPTSAAGRPLRQAAATARQRTALDLDPNGMPFAVDTSESSEEIEIDDRPVAQQAQQKQQKQQKQQAQGAQVEPQPEEHQRLPAEQRQRGEPGTAAEQQQQLKAEAERQAAAQQQAAEAERRKQQAAEEERRKQQAAEEERKQKQAAEAAEEQRRKQQAAEEEAQRGQAAEEAARQQRLAQQQQQAQQQAQQLGQKRDRDDAAAQGSEAQRSAKRQANAGLSPAAESQAQQQEMTEGQSALKQEQPAVKPEPGAGGPVDRVAAVRVAMPILRRAGITGATYIRFLNEYLKKNNDDAEVALAVELLQDCDASGDADAVRAMVESYLAQ